MTKILINNRKKSFLEKLAPIAQAYDLQIIVKNTLTAFLKYAQKNNPKIIIIDINNSKANEWLNLLSGHIPYTSENTLFYLLKSAQKPLPQKVLPFLDGVMYLTDNADILKLHFQNIKKNMEWESYCQKIETEMAKTKTELHEYKNLYDASKIINSTLNIDKALKLMINILSRLLQVKIISIMLLDQTSEELVVQAAKHERNIIGERKKLGEGISGRVAQSGVPIFVLDIDKINKDNLVNIDKYESKSFMCVPLKADNMVIGVVNVTDKLGEGIFSQKDKKILLEIASQISIALENAKLYSSVEILALQDGLTKLYNRNFFQKSLADEIRKAKHHDYSVSLIMLDIDFFKSFNDTYGHQVGDEVLKKIAYILKTSVRKTDVAARYGGEELISILIGADSKEAYDVAEKIRTRIADSQLYAIPVKTDDEQKHIVAEKINGKTNILLFPFSDDNGANLKNHWENLIDNAIKNPNTRSDKDFNIIKLNINASLGISSFPEDFGFSSKAASILESTNEQDLLIYMADKALYKAKKFGRNKVLTYKGVQEATILGMNRELELETIKKLLIKLKEKDKITYNHSLRVGKIAEIIAHKIGLNKEEFRLAKYGGFLHDIGKIFIAKELLCKPTDLDEKEYEIIKQHTLKGIALLDEYPVLYKYINAVKLHHEHIDGSGYPEKVTSTRIPIEARVIAVADSFDAMTQYRYYHPEMDPGEKNSAIAQIKSQSDILYDKTVITAFIDEIEKIKAVKAEDVVVD